MTLQEMHDICPHFDETATTKKKKDRKIRWTRAKIKRLRKKIRK